MLKIGYFADGPWAHVAFEKFVARDDVEISFYVPRFDNRDSYLVNRCDELGISVLYLKDVNSKESLEKVNEFQTDLFVSMSFNQILGKKIINMNKGFINCHAGKLPDYRGRNILNWMLINDEKEFGVTVHYVDEGIDTGDIILQEVYPIDDSDDYSTVFDKAVNGCADVLVKAVGLIITGKASRKRQAEIGNGFYCTRRSLGDELIEWQQTSRQLFNFIRAITKPSLGARCFCNKGEIKILSSKEYPMDRKYLGTPGVIVGRIDEGNLIKTLDGVLLLTKIEVNKEEKVPSFPIGFKLKGKQELIMDIVLKNIGNGLVK